MIDVCCAIIRNKTEILAVQRGPESSHPWQWEFPGGKIHPDETAEQAIIREIQEELVVQIAVGPQLTPVEFDYGKKQIRLIPFLCKIVSGEINLTEHMDKRWISSNEWELLNWSGADRELIMQNHEKLVRLINGKTNR